MHAEVRMEVIDPSQKRTCRTGEGVSSNKPLFEFSLALSEFQSRQRPKRPIKFSLATHC